MMLGKVSDMILKQEKKRKRKLELLKEHKELFFSSSSVEGFK